MNNQKIFAEFTKFYGLEDVSSPKELTSKYVNFWRGWMSYERAEEECTKHMGKGKKKQNGD